MLPCRFTPLTIKKAGLPTGFEQLQNFTLSSPAGETRSGQGFDLATKVEEQHGSTRTQIALGITKFLGCKDGNRVAVHYSRPDFTG